MKNAKLNINDKIIVALDEPNLLKQIEIVNKLGSEINFLFDFISFEIIFATLRAL